MQTITLTEIERELDKRHLYMVVTSQVELKNARAKFSWLAWIHSADGDVIGPIRRGTIRAAKVAAYEALIAKER